MYRITLAVASAAAVILMSYANANAADNYPARQRAQMDRLVQSVQPYNWTGFYVGGNVGYGRTNDQTDNFGVGKLKGALGSVEVGYNWQKPGSNFVIGGFYDRHFGSMKADATTDYWWGYSQTTSVSVGKLSTLGLRAGLAFDRIFLYGMVGLSTAEAKITYAYNSPWYSSTYNSVMKLNGNMLGAGAAYGITENLSANVEYRYYDLGTYGAMSAPVTVQTVMAGLKFKF